MQIGIEVKLPFYSWILDCETYDTIPSSIKYNDRDYYYSVENKTDNEMVISLFRDIETLESDKKYKILYELIQLINYIIYNARTFDVSVDLVLISPRNADSVIFKIISDGKISSEHVELKLEDPPHFKTLFEDLIQPGVFDVFTDIMEGEEPVLYFNLLVDSYHSYYEGRYSESVINSLTAIESIIYPILRNWLTESLFHKNEGNAEQILREIPSKFKFELLFGKVKMNLFGSIPDSNNLLEQLKNITTIRNNIIHNGKRATQNEAFEALDKASHLVEIITFEIPEM